MASGLLLSRATGAIFPSDTLPYIYFTVALRANVKPAHCKFKGRQFFRRVSHGYARLRFSATRDTTSSTDNHCHAAHQRCQGLLSGTLYGYLRVRDRPAMCVSLPMNASCCASVLPFNLCIMHPIHQLQPVDRSRSPKNA